MLKSKKTILKRRQQLGLLLIIIGIVMILIKAFAIPTNQEATLFYIEGYAEVVGQYPVEDGVIEYSVTFHNPTKNAFEISSAEPILTEQAKNILIDNIIPLEEVSKLKAGDILTYTGNFHVNTSHLTEEEIKKLMPLIQGYRVIYNKNKQLIIPLPEVAHKD